MGRVEVVKFVGPRLAAVGDRARRGADGHDVSSKFTHAARPQKNETALVPELRPISAPKPAPRFPKTAKTVRIIVGIYKNLNILRRGVVFAYVRRSRLPVAAASFTLKPFRPFGCASWSPANKFDHIVDHYRLVEAFGGILVPARGGARLITTLPPLGPDYSISFDEPEIMMNDGLGVLSLWQSERRLFLITFLLSSRNGEMVALIGGIQGRAEDGVLDIYRAMTKDAHGMRPRDLLIEIFQIICRTLGVVRIFAVADDATYHSDPYFGDHPLRVPRMDYDEIWRDRGGTRIDSLWYELPVHSRRREWSAIPSRKHALYRRRYAMIDAIEGLVRKNVISSVPGAA